MKLKKQLSRKNRFKRTFVGSLNQNFTKSHNSFLNYKKSLKIIFLFIKNNKRILIINPPKNIKKFINHFKNIKGYENSISKNKNLVKTIMQYHLVLIFSMKPQKIRRQDNKPSKSTKNGLLELSEPLLDIQFFKKTNAAKKPIILFGKENFDLLDDYFIEVADNEAEKESKTFIEILKSYLNYKKC